MLEGDRWSGVSAHPVDGAYGISCNPLVRDAMSKMPCRAVGENFLDIAPYIADARAGVLPLLGGSTGASAPYGFHDWEYLLSETGLLGLDRMLGWSSHVLGSVLMLLALVWGGVLLGRQWRRLSGVGERRRVR